MSDYEKTISIYKYTINLIAWNILQNRENICKIIKKSPLLLLKN